MSSYVSWEILPTWNKYESRDLNLGYLLPAVDDPAKIQNTVCKIILKKFS